MPKMSKLLANIKTSAIRRTAAWLALAKDKKEIISFGGGAPSLPPPSELVQKLREALNDQWKPFAYGGTRGTPELREAIVRDLYKYGKVRLDGPDNIIVTHGGTEGIFAGLGAILDPGDEVILADPTYLGYPEVLKIMNARAVTLPVSVDEGFQPKVETLKKKITKRTKAFVLLSPDNPTGRVIRPEIAKAIVDLACDHDFWIVCDDAYKHTIFEGSHTWASTLPGAEDRTLTICSFSKEASIPGLRLGYSYGSTEIIDAMEKYAQYLSLCPESLAQIAVTGYLADPKAKDRYLTEEVIPTYKQRCDAMGMFIEKYLPEARTSKPQGAFYYFVDFGSYLSEAGLNEEEFVDELRLKKSVIVIPGRVFGENGKNHVRMTFVSETDKRIEEGIKRISSFLKEKSDQKS
ncbi:MAG: pyridoxal phosphate-dependent aminotransferase [Promethearchaeati archaeon SRVP18_Atabeyarchaeia-1]